VGTDAGAPSSEVLKIMQKKWIMLSNPELPTYPSDLPHKCIYYILGLKHDRCESRVGEAVAGD
jgi:hypothetical protein